MEYTTNKFGVIIPKYITNSYENFGKEISNSELFIYLIFTGSRYVLEDKEKVKADFIDLVKDPGNKIAENLVESINSGKADEHLELKTYEQFYGQMAYARTIDNLLTYFKEILSEVILKRPSILKEKMPAMEKVARFSELFMVIIFVVERGVV